MKGMVSQCAVILTRGPVSLRSIASLLPDYGNLSPQSKQGPRTDTDWVFGDPRLIAPLRSHPRGIINIDYVGRPWPDDMGNPQTDAMVFGGWSMGHFGPFAYPGGLGRAVQQAHGWPEAASTVQRHDGFIRLRVSYLGGPNDTVLPPDYQPIPELEELTMVASRLTRMPEALCYFNSSGETLTDANSLAETLKWNASQGIPSLDVWTNIRMFNLKNQVPGWFMMDSVGMWQLDVRDNEAIFPVDRYDLGEVAGFLRNIGVYILQKGDVIKHRDTTNGPGGKSWQAFKTKDGFYQPPRHTLRWYPLDGSVAPQPIYPPEEDQ